jgi:hypothetical protein
MARGVVVVVAFSNLDKNEIWKNPRCCFFAVKEDAFLGTSMFIVSITCYKLSDNCLKKSKN